MRRIGLVSDTHGLLRPEVVEALEGVELICHLGDVGRGEILDELRRIAPVRAVRGNVDHGAWANALPVTDLVAISGANVYLLHNLAQLDLDPIDAGIQMVLHGHTHRPADEERDGIRYVNPGSSGPRRHDLPVSLAFLDEGLAVEFVTLPA